MLCTRLNSLLWRLSRSCSKNSGKLHRNLEHGSWCQTVTHRKSAILFSKSCHTQENVKLQDVRVSPKATKAFRQPQKMTKRLQLMINKFDENFKYVEKENEYFHSVLEKKKNYERYLLFKSEDIDHVTMSKQEMSKIWTDCCDDIDLELIALHKLSRFEQIQRFNLVNNPNFQSLSYSIINKIRDTTDEQLFRFMEILTTFGFRNVLGGESRPFRLELFHRINDECVRRFDEKERNWGEEQLFLTTDFCYAFRASSYNSATILHRLRTFVDENFNSLSRETIVLFMFYCNLSRQIPQNHLNKIFEIILLYLDDLDFEEIAIICLGLFKTNTPIYSPELLVRVMKSAMDNINTNNSIALSAIFKELNKSSSKKTMKHNAEFREMLGPLLDQSTIILQDHPFSTTILLFRFFLHKHFISESFIDELLHIVLKAELCQLRVKEISRLLFSLGNLTCYSNKLLLERTINKFLLELKEGRRQTELQLFPECLVQSLVGLSVIDVYDEELIHLLFGQHFQELLTSKRKSLKDVDYRREFFQLDQSLAIDRPGYQGNRLVKEFTTPVEQLKVGGRGYSKRKDLTAVRDVILGEVTMVLTSVLGGHQYLSESQLLHHFQTTDIEIRLDAKNKPLPVNQWRTSCKATPNDSNGLETSGMYTHLRSLLLELSQGPARQQRIAVVVFGPNCYLAYRDKSGQTSKQLVGLHEMKVRHLKELGYKVVKIPYFEFNRMEDQRKYLQQKIFS